MVGLGLTKAEDAGHFASWHGALCNLHSDERMAMTGGLASALAGPILLAEVALQVEGPGRLPTGAAAAAGRQHRGAGGSREAEQAPPARGGSRPG